MARCYAARMRALGVELIAACATCACKSKEKTPSQGIREDESTALGYCFGLKIGELDVDRFGRGYWPPLCEPTQRECDRQRANQPVELASKTCTQMYELWCANFPSALESELCFPTTESCNEARRLDASPMKREASMCKQVDRWPGRR